MSERELPLGQRESEQLEFKGRDALRDRRKIAREVVAMLNAEGGEIWIGIGEEGGRGVKVEPIEKAEREEPALLDSLVDSIEPAIGDEVKVRWVRAETGQVLLVEVAGGGSGKPYAYSGSEGTRGFVRRVGARIRPLTREELTDGLCSGAARAEERLEDARRRVEEERQAVLEDEKNWLWVRIEPVPGLDLDLQDEELAELLDDPVRSGNRRAGITFAGREAQRPSIDQRALMAEVFRENGALLQRVELYPSGGMSLRVDLARLLRHRQYGKIELAPLALLELPTSLFRLARAIYERNASKPERVLGELLLTGLEGKVMWEGTPGDSFFYGNECGAFERDFLLPAPLSFTYRELRESPDQCGFRLVRQVYQELGWRDDAMPSFYDREARRLVLE